MRAAAFLIAAILLCLLPLGAAAEPVSISVTRHFPDTGASLPDWGKVYLDVAYSADEPVRFQASAFRNGKPVTEGAAMNGAVVHPAGTGHALVWVAFTKPAEADEIRITAYDEKFGALTAVAEPFRARWSGEAARDGARPPVWVVRLRQNELRRAGEYARAHPPAPDPVGDAVVSLIFLMVPGYFIAQALGAYFLRGGWRKAALVPLVLMAPAVVVTILGILSGSNLAPIYLVFVAPLAMIYLMVLFAARAVSHWYGVRA
jgi:hypothetical protein